MTFSGGTSAAAAAAANAASPLWVDTQISTLSGVTEAVQFCGSIVAWLKNGAPYSASTRVAALASAASTSPSLRTTAASGAVSPPRRNSAILALETLPFCPSSQVTGSASTAVFAPPAVGNDGNGIRQPHDLADTF